jgi:hypothetical protein
MAAPKDLVKHAEWIKNISEGRKGISPWNKGKKCPEIAERLPPCDLPLSGNSRQSGCGGSNPPGTIGLVARERSTYSKGRIK